MYAKFFKDILSNRRKLEEIQQIELNFNESALIRNELPKKLDDPGKFSVPCAIRNMKFKHALCDLGASVSLMPKSVFDKARGWRIKTNKNHFAVGRPIDKTPYRNC